MKNCKYILFIVVQLMSLLVFAQNQQLKFERIGTKEGLSDVNINCFMQDSRGFLWIGTRYGLNRYDGNKFKIFYSNPADTTSLSSSYIQYILEDSKENIWIATSGGGFNKFDRKSNRFKHYTHQPTNPNTVSGNIVNKLAEDKTGKLWIATNNGLDLFDPQTSRFIRFENDPNNNKSLSENVITSLCVDSQGSVWIGTQNGGLNKFDYKDSTFVRYQTDISDPESISGNSVMAIFEDHNQRLWVGAADAGLNFLDRKTGKFKRFSASSEAGALIGNNILSLNEDDIGNLWIGTENGGISLFNYQTQKVTTFVNDEIDDHSLSKNSVYCISKDRIGNMWLGLYTGGINLYKKSTGSFNHFKRNSSSNSLTNDFVLSFYEDKDENLWIGTDGGGLNYFDHQTGKLLQYIHHPKKNSIAGNYVLTLGADRKDNLWIGTWGDGLSKLNLTTGKFSNYKLTNDPTGLSSNNIFDLAPARDGKVWIGTFNGGVNLYDEHSNQFAHFKYDKEDSTSISSDNIFSILVDQTDRVWIGTFDGGICLYDPKTNGFIRFNKENKRLINNSVAHILESKSGIIYVSTLGGGLNYFDPEANRFMPIEMGPQLESDYMYAALEDDHGDLWISTNKGITRYNPKNHTVNNYSVEDGLQEGAFKPHSAYKSKSGKLYFGGVNGFNSFFPDQIIKSRYDAPIVLTDFQIFYNSVSVSQNEHDPSPLKQDISETKSIRLSYDQNFITFEFESLDFSSPESNVYAYMLEGFDEDFTPGGSKNSATYMNLDPGDYVFLVKSQNRSGEWSAQTLQLEVTIVPPFWLTWWFKTLMGLILVIVPLVFTSWRIKQLGNQREKLEELVADRTKEIQNKNELLKDLNSTKDKLFSIISHDLRSPFNTILGFQDLLLNDYFELSDTDRLGMIRQVHSTTNQVYDLVENLLNWARVQTNNIQPHPVKINLKELILGKVDLYRHIAESKGISLIIQVPDDLLAFADINLLDTSLRNLTNNAIKFTPGGGSILIQASQQDEGEIVLSVTDSGTGMTKEQVESLFNLEKTRTKSGTNGEQGSGLGLVLCKEFVEKNKGAITVESQLGIGSMFSFTVPSFTNQ